jgi:monomeric sarcosine oxidase
MSHNYDAIVLGAGALGSAAAYHLVKAGQRVLLLEQFEFDHQKGSSHGLSRIIRYAYDYPQYVELAKVVYPMWQAFEQEAGEQLYTRTGGIDFGQRDQASLRNTITTLQQTGIPHEILSMDEARKRFPQFHFDDNTIVLYQADTGILAASKCVLAHLRLAEKQGATILSNTPITAITAQADSVTVKTTHETHTAGKLIITAGSWAQSILATLNLNLPLATARCQEIYFNAHEPDLFITDVFPAFIAHMKTEFGRMPYGMASHHNSGVKVCWHGGSLFNHPSEIDYQPDMNEVEQMQSKFTRHYLPGLTDFRSARVCLYTMTPDEHWVIDKHPQYPHIVFAGGCSGHAFKFSTLIGKILTDLALTGETPHDISLFKVSRFM